MKQFVRKPSLRMFFSLLVGFGLAFLMVGCATIVNGTSQRITVNSIPSGAKVIIKGVYIATTPAIIELNRKESSIVIRFEKEGYEPVEISLNRSISFWIIGNTTFTFAGLIGLAIDFISGAAYNFSPSEIQVILNELKEQEELEEQKSLYPNKI